VNTVPDKCPFCESPIMVHNGNLLRSEDGGFATYECKTEQDVGWPDDQWKRTGQKERCRRREVQLLTKQRDEARGRIKRLEEAGNEMAAWLSNPRNLGDDPFMASQWRKAKEAKL
jgi:hypothetical protein